MAKRVGELKRTQNDEVEWRIPNFLSSSLPEQLDSPTFNILEYDWALSVMQYGKTDVFLGHVGVCLHESAIPLSPLVECSLSIKSAAGQKNYETHNAEDNGGCNQRFYYLLPKSELMCKKKLLLPGGALTIVCSFTVPDQYAASSLTNTRALFFATVNQQISTMGKLVGELKKNQTDEVEWRIPDFLSLSFPEHLKSPAFNILEDKWDLSVLQYGQRDVFLGHVGVFLIKSGSTLSPLEKCSLSIKSAAGQKYYETHNAEDTGYNHQRFYYLLPKSELKYKKKLLLPDGALTIVCSFTVPDQYAASSITKHEVIERKDKIEKGDPVIKKEVENGSVTYKGLDRLSEDLKNMLLLGQNTDVVLKADQREFRVHKAILAARSPAFASMFQHEMSEKTSGTVDIPDCPAESFDVFLQYLYSGKADAMSSDNVFNLYYAADKYQVNDLKEECVEYMKNNLMVNTVCDVVAFSICHCEKELQGIATQFFCENAKAIVKTVQWQEYLKENLTQANELIIKAFNA